MKMIKKLSLVFVILLVFSVCAFAGEGSDTIGACKLLPELRYSYYEADMGLKSDTVPTFINYTDWRLKEHTASLQVTYGLTDYVDLYAFVGARVAGTKSGDVEFGRLGHMDLIFDLGQGFTGGAGVKGTFYRSPKGLYVGGGLEFIWEANTVIRDFTREIEGLPKVSDADNGIHWADSSYTLIADLHAGWTFKKIGLTPYVGVEYLWNREYMKLINTDFKYTGTNPSQVGVYVGLDYLATNNLYFNVEGHMVDRWGGSASVGLLFDLCEKPAPAPEPTPAPPIEPKLEPMSKN
jgi:hypothetical protein